MIKITRESLRDAGACYTDEHIAALVPAEGLSPGELVALDIPAYERYWALLYASGAPENILWDHAYWCLQLGKTMHENFCTDIISISRQKFVGLNASRTADECFTRMGSMARMLGNAAIAATYAAIGDLTIRFVAYNEKHKQHYVRS